MNLLCPQNTAKIDMYEIFFDQFRNDYVFSSICWFYLVKYGDSGTYKFQAITNLDLREI